MVRFELGHDPPDVRQDDPGERLRSRLRQMGVRVAEAAVPEEGGVRGWEPGGIAVVEHGAGRAVSRQPPNLRDEGVVLDVGPPGGLVVRRIHEHHAHPVVLPGAQQLDEELALEAGVPGIGHGRKAPRGRTLDDSRVGPSRVGLHVGHIVIRIELAHDRSETQLELLEDAQNRLVVLRLVSDGQQRWPEGRGIGRTAGGVPNRRNRPGSDGLANMK